MGYRVKPFTMAVRDNSTQEFIDVGLLVPDVGEDVSDLQKRVGTQLDDNSVVVTDIAEFTPESNKEYYFFIKNYSITNTIQFSASNIRIHGNGCVINNPNNAPVFKVTGDNVEIDGFIINNNNTTYDVSANITPYGTIEVNGTNTSIHNNEIKRVNNSGIFINGSGEVHHNHIDGMLTLGVYDTITRNNHHMGLNLINYNGSGNFEAYDNIIENLVEGIYFGDGKYDSTNRIFVHVHDNTFRSCIDHSVYLNGGYNDVVEYNTMIETGGISVQSLRSQVIKHNVLFEGFNDSSLSAVQGAAIINIREPSNAVIDSNYVLQRNITEHRGRIIYLSPVSNAFVLGTANEFHNVSVSNNYIDVYSGTAFALGTDNTTSIYNLSMVGNMFVVDTPYFEPLMCYGKIYESNISGNTFKINTLRNYGIQLSDVSNTVISNNVFDDTYLNNAQGRTFVQTGNFSNVMFIGNRTNGCLFALTANDTIEAIGNEAVNLPLCNALVSVSNLNVSFRGNRFKSDTASKRGTLTTNSSGNASVQGPFIPGMMVNVFPDTYTADFTSFYAIGTNGWLTINTNKANTTIHYEIV